MRLLAIQKNTTKNPSCRIPSAGILIFDRCTAVPGHSGQGIHHDHIIDIIDHRTEYESKNPTERRTDEINSKTSHHDLHWILGRVKPAEHKLLTCIATRR